ncbi:MAG: CAP domain-containing protein [Bacteroidales bacterium]
MKTILFTVTFFLSLGTLCAQKADSVYYYSKLNVKNFRQDSFFNQAVDFNNPDYSRLNAAVFFATNEQRAKRKLKLLDYSQKLEEMASMHSKEMCEKDFFNHINPKNKKKKTPADRATLAGISNPYIAENIATAFGLQYEPNKNARARGPGKFSYTADGELIPPNSYLMVADMLVKSWMNSEGHRKNILSQNALQLGCGTCLFFDKGFNEMPVFKATQNFQEYERINTAVLE